MPHSSSIGTPMAWKNSITAGGVGAAPTDGHSTSSKPIRGRIFDSTSSSALAYSASSSAPTGLAGLLERAP